MQNRNKNKGFTLVETLVVLVVGIIVIAAAAAGFSKAFGSNEVSTEARNITEIIANARALKEPSGYPANLVTPLRAAGNFPSSYAINATTSAVSHTWGGAVTVAGEANRFYIDYAAVPEQACVKLAPKVAGSGAVLVYVGSTLLDPASATALSTQADSACGASNTVRFTTAANPAA